MLVAALILNLILAGLGQQQTPPVPQPFPRPGPAQPTTPRPAPQQPAAPTTPPKPATTAPAPATPPAADQPEADPTEATLGVPIYPGAQFIKWYSAGRGQRYYLFGSSALFGDVVAYYRNVLKQKGQLVFEVPATHQFDIGKFDQETMAFPPGVTVKDFQSEISRGFPNPKVGAQPERFPTIVQIVPVK